MINNLISVIIPCFNAEKYIEETISSILNQTHSAIECIVVDDGSTDNSANLVKYIGLADHRVKYLYQPNSGPAVARNYGIKRSSGQYIQFLDSDDTLSESKLADQVKIFSCNQNIDIVYGGYWCYYDGEKENLWTYSRVELKGDPFVDFASNWEKDLSIPIHCFLFLKKCFDKWGMFDPKMRLSNEDWDLHLKFALSGAKYYYSHDQSVFYRVSKKSRCKITQNMYKDKIRMLIKYIFTKHVPFGGRWILIKRLIEAIKFDARC